MSGKVEGNLRCVPSTGSWLFSVSGSDATSPRALRHSEWESWICLHIIKSSE